MHSDLREVWLIFGNYGENFVKTVPYFGQKLFFILGTIRDPAAKGENYVARQNEARETIQFVIAKPGTLLKFVWHQLCSII